MSLITDEIQQLQLRILQLQKQKEKEEIHHIKKKESIKYNLEIISDEINDKKTFIDNKRRYIENKYKETITKSQIDEVMNDKNNKYGAYEEQKIHAYLEAIYNILQILDKRISDLENK